LRTENWTLESKSNYINWKNFTVLYIILFQHISKPFRITCFILYNIYQNIMLKVFPYTELWVNMHLYKYPLFTYAWYRSKANTNTQCWMWMTSLMIVEHKQNMWKWHYITQSRYFVCGASRCVEGTHIDNNRQSQFFFCIGWFNATCFVLTRCRQQANKKRKDYCVRCIILFLIFYVWLESPLHKISQNYTKCRNQ